MRFMRLMWSSKDAQRKTDWHGTPRCCHPGVYEDLNYVLVHQAGFYLSPVFDLSMSSLSGMNHHVFVFQGQVTGQTGTASFTVLRL